VEFVERSWKNGSSVVPNTPIKTSEARGADRPRAAPLPRPRVCTARPRTLRECYVTCTCTQSYVSGRTWRI
jgi:hypothetical protein